MGFLIDILFADESAKKHSLPTLETTEKAAARKSKPSSASLSKQRGKMFLTNGGLILCIDEHGYLSMENLCDIPSGKKQIGLELEYTGQVSKKFPIYFFKYYLDEDEKRQLYVKNNLLNQKDDKDPINIVSQTNKKTNTDYAFFTVEKDKTQNRFNVRVAEGKCLNVPKNEESIIKGECKLNQSLFLVDEQTLGETYDKYCNQQNIVHVDREALENQVNNEQPTLQNDFNKLVVEKAAKEAAEKAAEKTAEKVAEKLLEGKGDNKNAELAKLLSQISKQSTDTKQVLPINTTQIPANNGSVSEFFPVGNGTQRPGSPSVANQALNIQQAAQKPILNAINQGQNAQQAVGTALSGLLDVAGKGLNTKHVLQENALNAANNIASSLSSPVGNASKELLNVAEKGLDAKQALQQAALGATQNVVNQGLNGQQALQTEALKSLPTSVGNPVPDVKLLPNVFTNAVGKVLQ